MDYSVFSEDLDFILYQPEKNFRWRAFIEEIKAEFSVYGLSVKIKDRSEANEVVKKAFLKDDSFGRVLSLKYERIRSDMQTINIKLEIDTHPPLGSQFESKLVTFPTPFSIVAQDIPSLFAGKIHALLCRNYVKGRDWYDFTWYVTRKSPVNIELLKNALFQQGPWSNQNIKIDNDWIVKELTQKTDSINWEVAKKDIYNFVKVRERQSIELWNKQFFLHFIHMLSEHLPPC